MQCALSYVTIADAKKKNWNFDLKDYKLLVSKLETLRPDLVISKIPQFVFKALNEDKHFNHNIDLSRIDSELLNALLPFQRDGVM